MAEETLDTQTSEALVELFFDCEAPDERDALFDLLARRNDGIAHSFLVAVLQHDEDPFLQVAAACALLPTEPDQATAHLLAHLDAQDDELLFEEAVYALLQRPPVDLYQRLDALGRDTGRDVAERRLAKLALMQLDEAQAHQGCLRLLQDAEAMMQEPLDLMSVAMTVLVRSGTPEDLAALEAAQGRLPPPPVADEADPADAAASPVLDLQALHDLFDEARTLVAAGSAEADPEEAAAPAIKSTQA